MSDIRKSRFGVCVYDIVKIPKVKCRNCGHVITINDYRRVPYVICNVCKHKTIIDKKLNFKNELLRKVGQK